ncbi:MAG TPA: hypothetical protein VFR06_04970 [Gallionellaceae bacterium]|nr:hypothetical protein [Gallionellaceae bacterium]
MNSTRVWMAGTVLMVLALLLLLAQHWGMSFTNADDPWIVQLGYDKGLWQGSLDAAKVQGRFWLVPINILAQLPLLPDSWAFVNVLRMLVNGLVFLGFVLFCSKLTNRFAAVLMGLVWLALIDLNSSDFSAIHGYLMMFNLQFIFLFFSFYLFLDRLDRRERTGPIIVPYLLYAFAMLAYEPMFFYSLAFPALYLYRQQGKKVSLLRHAGNFLRRNWMLVAVMLGYVVLYFGFRKFMATGTRGIDTGGSLDEIVKTIYLFSIHGFHFELKPLTAAVLEQFSAASVAAALFYALLVGVALLLLIPRINDEYAPNTLCRKSSLAVLVFFTLSPNILYGFVEGYRQWANYDPHYVGNYLSSFPLAMLITLGLLYLVGGSKARQEKILFALILYVFASAAFDNYLRWEKLADINRRGSAQWQAALRNLDQRTYPQDRTTLICAGTTPDHVTGDDRYWSKYLSRRYAADVRFVSRKVSKAGCDVVLDFSRS